ncbi:MAG: hypothetical protein LPH19_11245 [Shewanella sp.]|nr:hypothetical protein [Shewanella sp.]
MLAMGLAGLSLWGHHQRDSQQQKSERLQHAEQAFLVQIRPAIAVYLGSGDAGRLQFAADELATLQRTLTA